MKLTPEEIERAIQIKRGYARTLQRILDKRPLNKAVIDQQIAQLALEVDNLIAERGKLT